MSARKIEIVNEKILKGLKAKDGYLKIMQECAKEGEELQKKDDQALQHLSREDEKVRPEIIREIKKIDLTEFEDVSRVYHGLEEEDKDKVFIEIIDKLEEWKEGFKKAKEESKNGKDNGDSAKQKITDTGDNA